MKYSAKQYARALHQVVFESTPNDQDKILDNFVNVLKTAGDLVILNDIEKEFYECDREARGIQSAEIITAKALSAAEEAKIIKELNEYVGRQVELKKQVDEELLGGVVIKIGDELIDGSVRKSLKDLKEQLIK